MPPPLYLGLVLHNHQPVGNFDFVIEQVYDQAYAPMLAALEAHPRVRVAMHVSGCLFDWLDARRPEYITRLRALCDRGQVEMMTGGYYEPVLPMIPDADKAGQIEKLTRFVEQRLGQRPDGLWLTERVWEPGLPAPLADAGVRWTLVDDAHFRMAGLRDAQLDGYYVTEDQGRRVNLFAGSQRLRYAIPWLGVDDAMAELRQAAAAATSDAPYLVLGDDGEKFGAWPTTHAHVWEEGWIEQFFSAIEGAADWLVLMTPGEYARRFDARGLVYLPAASYSEMMEWALPADASAEYHHVAEQMDREGRHDVLRYTRGGTWRFFLAKYPEANAMHKRGLRIAAKLGQAPCDEARDAMWQAQCNCPYWHGVFGGLYLRHIRAATNRNLVRAERLADEAAGATGVTLREDDVDFDGHGEVLAQSPDISLLIHPKLGGMISEFDLRRSDHALLDVLPRRREAYHEALLAGQAQAAGSEMTNIHGGLRVKEEGLQQGLVFDRYRRGGAQEWILDAGATVQQFARGEAAVLFEPDGAWSCETRLSAAGAAVLLEREAGGWRVRKEIAVPPAGEAVTVRYRVTNAGDAPRRAIFVSEWNVSPPEDPLGARPILSANGWHDPAAGPAAIELRGSFAIGARSDYTIDCGVPGEARLWHFPVETVSSSEGGLERVGQGFSLSVVRELDLAPGAEARLELAWRVRRAGPYGA